MSEELIDDIYKIKEKLNIDIIGFTNCESLNHREKLLENRIKKNRYTEFEEIDIESRINPRKYFEDCKSIITIGISYNTDYELQNNGYRFKGRLSKTSWGMDYHHVLNDLMKCFVVELNEKYKFNYEITVDTGPLLDREIAYRSGIGYFGKNASIINEEYGSFIFLGYILTDLDIKIQDQRKENLCGDCTKCLDACPTKALESPFNVNPKKCISYLTQTKENIRSEYRDKMKNQLYGCDICQSVCPMNKGIKLSKREEFYPIDTNGELDIEEIFKLSNKEFKNKYGNMSGAWRGKSIFLRNSIISLGNSHNNKKEAILLLEKELENKNNKYEDYILWAIKKLKE